jgi:hypothetical protein
MRPRRPSDWVADLGGRHELETEVRSALAARQDLVLLRSSTNSLDRLDYQLEYSEQFVELELKTKNQRLSQGWQQLRPEVREADLFVMDELALRKITDAGRFAFLLVWDAPNARWALWSSGDLLVASRRRHTRALDTPAGKTKGKLLFDISEAGYICANLDAALDALVAVAAHLESWWQDIAPWPPSGAVTV